MTPPRILIVDDQRDITRMLRIAIEALGRGYLVSDVPSAEEALLEVRRAPVDVLVTDLRLPGISGLELIKRLRSQASQAAMIVISAHADEGVQNECRRLGAIFFPKPLSLDAFLTTVQQTVGAKARAAAAAPPEPAEQPGIADRLARLRRDLGALAVFLIDLDGQVAVRAGDVSRLDLDTMLAPLMSAFSASLKVSRALGAQVPANLHFFDGDSHDVYVANVGQQFALAIIFSGERGAQQMGPVMRYGRQCADDLLGLIQRLGVDPAPGARPPATPAVTAALAPPKTAALGAPAVRKRTSPLLKKRTGHLGPKDAPPTPPAEPPPTPAVPAAPLTPEELTALDEAAAKVTAAAAADFWDQAADGALGEVRSDTLSWDQAEKLGLLPQKTSTTKTPGHEGH